MKVRVIIINSYYHLYPNGVTLIELAVPNLSPHTSHEKLTRAAIERAEKQSMELHRILTYLTLAGESPVAPIALAPSMYERMPGTPEVYPHYGLSTRTISIQCLGGVRRPAPRV